MSQATILIKKVQDEAKYKKMMQTLYKMKTFSQCIQYCIHIPDPGSPTNRVKCEQYCYDRFHTMNDSYR